MPNPTWPAAPFPQYVLEQGFSEAEPDNTIESQMEAGPLKTRRRYTLGHSIFTVAIATDVTGRATFDTFYQTTTKDGSLPFDWVHPITRAACTFMFRKPVPKWSVKGSMYICSFALEKIT